MSDQSQPYTRLANSTPKYDCNANLLIGGRHVGRIRWVRGYTDLSFESRGHMLYARLRPNPSEITILAVTSTESLDMWLQVEEFTPLDKIPS